MKVYICQNYLYAFYSIYSGLLFVNIIVNKNLYGKPWNNKLYNDYLKTAWQETYTTFFLLFYYLSFLVNIFIILKLGHFVGSTYTCALLSSLYNINYNIYYITLDLYIFQDCLSFFYLSKCNRILCCVVCSYIHVYTCLYL